MALGPNSDRCAFSSTVTKDNRDKLDKLYVKTCIPKTKLTDMAFELLFEKFKSQGIQLTGE